MIKTTILVMAHGAVLPTIERHEKYWTRWGDVTYLTAFNDGIPGNRGLQFSYGPPEHHGFESNRRVLYGLKQATQGMPTNIILMEYDCLILGNDKSWLKQVPKDAIWCPAFNDTRVTRGFVGTTFCHPPVVMNTKMACHLVHALEEIGPGVEFGFWDRYVGYACEQYQIPIQNMWTSGECFARNPIEGEYVDQACEAVKLGARFIHGVKDEATLRRIESCVPASL